MSIAARNNNNDPPRLVLAGAARAADAPDAISAWLDVFVRLLRFPESERAGVREELESHLRERVRDLVLTDVNEVEAQRRAIAELGDAAELAQRYVAAKRTPTRRLVMNGLVAVAAGAALITSLVAVNHGPPAGSKAVEYQPPAVAAAGDSSGNKVAAHNFDKTPLRQVFAAVAADLGRPLTLNEAALGQLNTDMDAQMTLRLEAGDLNSALKRINAALADHQGMLDWRVTAAQLEVATREHFDQLETKLISMELGSYFSLPEAKHDAVVQLISQMVEPEGWLDNGGNTSRMSIVGQKLFVKAPPRVVAQVAWIVDRLNDVGDKPGAAANADRDMQASLRRRLIDEDRARADEAAARKHKDDAEAAARDARTDLERKRKAEDEAAVRAAENSALERKRKDEAEAAAGRPADPRSGRGEALPGSAAPGTGGTPPKQNQTPGLPGASASPAPRGGGGGGGAGGMPVPPNAGAGGAAPASATPGLPGGAPSAPAAGSSGSPLPAR
ncbi:MAG: permease prefix domain 1-containing protein [Phycisphaerales bacterium]